MKITGVVILFVSQTSAKLFDSNYILAEGSIIGSINQGMKDTWNLYQDHLKYGDLDSRSVFKKWDRIQEIRESDPWELEKKYGVNDLSKWGIKSLKAIEEKNRQGSYMDGYNEGYKNGRASVLGEDVSSNGVSGNGDSGRNWDDEFSPNSVMRQNDPAASARSTKVIEHGYLDENAAFENQRQARPAQPKRNNFEQENTGGQGGSERNSRRAAEKKPEILSESNADLAEMIKNDPDYYKDSPKTDPIEYKKIDDRNVEQDQQSPSEINENEQQGEAMTNNSQSQSEIVQN